MFLDGGRRSKIQFAGQLPELDQVFIVAQDCLHVLEPLNQIRHGIGLVQGPFLLIPDGFDQQAEPVKRFAPRLGPDTGHQLPEGVCVSLARRLHPVGEPRRVRGRRSRCKLADDPFNRRVGARPVDLFTYGAEAVLDSLAVSSWRIELCEILFEDLQRSQFAQPCHAALDGAGGPIFADQLEIGLESPQMRAGPVQGLRVRVAAEESLRPLTAKGAEKTRDAISGLLRMELQPGYLWTSPLTRAFDTAKIIRQMLCPRLELQVQEALLPEASPDKLLALLVSLPSDATVICVGHEPHLGETAGMFLFGKPVTGLSLKKAGACCLRFRETPKACRAELRWWLLPAQLRSLR